MLKLRQLVKFNKFFKIETNLKNKNLQYEILKKDTIKILERNQKQTKKISKLVGGIRDLNSMETNFYGLEMNLVLFIEHYKEESLYIKTLMDFYKIDYLLVR